MKSQKKQAPTKDPILQAAAQERVKAFRKKIGEEEYSRRMQKIINKRWRKHRAQMRAK